MSEPIERDHPAGRYRGRPVNSAVVSRPRDEHVAVGRVDRAAGVEGGAASARRVLGRVAARLGLAAATARPIAPDEAAALAQVIEDVAAQSSDYADPVPVGAVLPQVIAALVQRQWGKP
jgi:hypothetical protein